jgi:diguanylate cyclase (GGDEF)-like protein
VTSGPRPALPLPDVTILADAPLPVALFDVDLVRQWANPAFDRLAADVSAAAYGAVPAGRAWVPDVDCEQVAELLAGTRDTVVTEFAERPLSLASDDGRPDVTRYWTATFFAVRGDDGTAAGVAVIVYERTQAVLRERALTHRATHDALTGLPNRQELYERLAAAQARTGRSDGALVLLLLDLDEFKSINDRLGHLAGDQVLVEVAGRLRRVVRDGDTVARLGGDEFALVCEGLSGPGDVAAMVTRTAAAVAEPMVVANRTIAVNASIGTAVVRPDEIVEQVVARADRAMYAVKTTAPPAAEGRRPVPAALR